MYETGDIRWNSDAQALKEELESIIDSNGDKVFGSVGVSRVPYVAPLILHGLVASMDNYILITRRQHPSFDV